MHPSWSLSLVLAFAAPAAVCSGTSAPMPSADSAPRASLFANAAPGVRLQYLDFGGSGDTLILLAGAGNSAYIFDYFAPLLTDSFHVYAMTRRGFGESSRPASGYDTKTLSEDILAFMDVVGITRADIVGHSIAGAEMTRLADDHPDRVNKLVYLDAAYDWRLMSEATMIPSPPAQPRPDASDLASPRAFAAYLAKMEGVPDYPESDVIATWIFSSNGRLLRPVTPAAIVAAVGTGAAARHPDYADVRAPALAIYTVPESTKDMFPWISRSQAQARVAAAYFTFAQALLATQRANFSAAAPKAAVVEMTGLPHYVFLLEPNVVAQYIKTFLLQ